ncbi:hypothetical protein ENSA5_57710 [Enhygromyxa salina]|uniref:TPM domain-containing protein n=1 Tax=Enhygromyxa salina TaxID=215803 RepID=A0A2S9XE64_9BACT|nr:hypothetical protein ENSA5_57710 [Enhygromyxa salina]
MRRTAERAFARLGVGETRAKNGVLIFVAPARRRVVVLGDEGIDAQVGPWLWDAVADALGDAFCDGRYTDGLIAAIETIGEALAIHFPADPSDNPNELPDAVDLGAESR